MSSATEDAEAEALRLENAASPKLRPPRCRPRNRTGTSPEPGRSSPAPLCELGRPIKVFLWFGERGGAPQLAGGRHGKEFRSRSSAPHPKNAEGPAGDQGSLA